MTQHGKEIQNAATGFYFTEQQNDESLRSGLPAGLKKISAEPDLPGRDFISGEQSGVQYSKGPLGDPRHPERAGDAIALGRQAKLAFGEQVTGGITEEELQLYWKISEQIRRNVIRIAQGKKEDL